MAADTAPVPDENAEEIIDLTELIERGDTASAPKSDIDAPDLTAQTGGEDAEIEALLAQMDAGDSATSTQGPATPLDDPGPAPAAPASVDPNEQLDMSDMGDIDNILASLDIPPQPRESTPTPPPTTPQAPPTTAPTADIAQDLDQAMDELLGGNVPQPPQSAPVTPAAPDILQDLDQAMDELLGDSAPQPPQTVSPAPADTPSVDDLLAAATTPAAPNPDPGPDLEADLDALLNDPTLAAPNAAISPAPGASDVGADLTNLLTSLDAETTPAPEPVVPAEAALQSVMDRTDIPEQRPAAPAAAASPTPPDMAAKESTLDATAPMNTAPEPTPTPEIAGDLGERLRQCEANLAVAHARIEALEHSTADSVSLGDLLREGSPLHNGFAALIASSVGQALKDTPPSVSLPKGLPPLSTGIEMQQKSLLARMDAIEARLDSLEPRFNEEVGKAAASAVARILREEISRLVQG